MYSDEELKNAFSRFCKTDHEFNKTISAYKVFATPYHKAYDSFTASPHGKKKISDKYVGARNTIADLFDEVGGPDFPKEDILGQIDEAIEWLTLTERDIKKPYKNLAEKMLLSIPMSKTKVKEVLSYFKHLVK